MIAPAFQLRGIGKQVWAGETPLSILADIDLTIQRGEYVAIIGPSGSGKSTLMQIMGCLDHPTAGSLHILGEDVSLLSDDQLSNLRCRSLGFVFQAFHLLPAYDALANVALAMAYAGRDHRFERARELLTQLGLEHRLHHKPATLSGGEKQRVAIARAIANESPILLADEPTGALDRQNGQAVMEWMKEFHAKGRTLIVVTHDKSVALQAERVIEMVDGRIQRDRLGRDSFEWND